MSEEYIFDTGSELGKQQVDFIQVLLDTATVAALEEVAVAPGMRCLEVGAGGGSIARWMADRVGDTGGVVAVDLDTTHVENQPNIEAHRHDITTGIPVDGTFDVIHTRQTLMHIAQRETVFKMLVEALAPGGWLIIGDFSARKLTPLSVPRESDRELWNRMQYLSHEVVGPARGMSFDWAHSVGTKMEEAGLINIDSTETSRTTRGGDSACQLHRNLNIQAEPLLAKAGATSEEMERYRELMLDPRFRAWFYQLICTRGQKPAA